MWLKTVYSTFQDADFGHNYHSLSIDATIMVSQNSPITGEHGTIFVAQMGFRATLNFRKFKVALNPMHRIVLNFAKSHISSCLSKFCIRKNFTKPFLKYKRLKLKLRLFLAGHSVAMVVYCATKIAPMCSPVISQFFNTMIVASNY